MLSMGNRNDDAQRLSTNKCLMYHYDIQAAKDGLSSQFGNSRNHLYIVGLHLFEPVTHMNCRSV